MARLATPALLVGLLWASEAHCQGFDRGELLRYRLRPQARQTLTTEHFRVHYPPRLADLAAHIAHTAERAHVEVTAQLGRAPRRRTHIVLTAQSDEPSIFTFTAPHPQIFFDVTLPHMGRGLNDYASWHQWLLTHEYAHVAHLGPARGPFAVAQTLLGPWATTQLASAPWLKEGVATAVETRATPLGRGGSSTYRMMLRIAVDAQTLQNGAFGGLDRMGHFEATAWPWVHRPYVLGHAMVETYAASGPGLAGLAHAAAGAVPWTVPGLRRAGLRSGRELWDRTQARIIAEARAESEALRQRPFTPVQFLTDTGFLYSGLDASPDGRWLVATHEVPDEDPEILRFELSDPEAEPVVLQRRSGGSQSSFSASSRFLAFDSVSRAAYGEVFSDLYILDQKSGQLVTRSRGLRARDPAVHPDGRHLAFVVNRDGTNRLWMTDTAFGGAVDLLGDVGFRRVSNPRFSPSGDSLVVGVRRESGGEDLWRIDAEGNTSILVGDGAENRHPSWTPDGRFVLFSSDRDGVFNIHRIEVATGRRAQLTHVLGGLFWPVLAPGSSFVHCVGYHAGGYDLARFPWEPGAPAEDAPEELGVAPSAPVPLPKSDLRPRRYQGARHLGPQYLQPSVLLLPGRPQIGARVGAVDPLFHLFYELEGRFDLAARQPVARLYVFNGGRPVAADLEARLDVVPVLDGEPLQAATARAQLLLGMAPDHRRLHLRPGLVASWIDFAPSGPVFGYSLGFTFDTEHRRRNQSFAESGSLVEVDVRHFVLSGNPALAEAPLSITGRTRHHLALGRSGGALHLGADGGLFSAGGQRATAAFVGGRTSFPFGLQSQFLVLGLRPNALASSAVGIGTTAFSFRLAALERGLGGIPLFFGRLSGAVRLQGGFAEGAGPLGSVGLELHQELVVGFVNGLSARLGVYQDPFSERLRPTPIFILEASR